MDDRKTIRIQKSMFDDQGLNKSHASLIVLKGAEIGRDFRLRKSMVIGRSTRADICLPDKEASREHARISYEATGKNQDRIFTLPDMGSRNRSFVTSRPVESVQLLDGD